jgi:hypothetical protein
MPYLAVLIAGDFAPGAKSRIQTCICVVAGQGKIYG